MGNGLSAEHRGRLILSRHIGRVLASLQTCHQSPLEVHRDNGSSCLGGLSEDSADENDTGDEAESKERRDGA